MAETRPKQNRCLSLATAFNDLKLPNLLSDYAIYPVCFMFILLVSISFFSSSSHSRTECLRQKATAIVEIRILQIATKMTHKQFPALELTRIIVKGLLVPV